VHRLTSGQVDRGPLFFWGLSTDVDHKASCATGGNSPYARGLISKIG